MVLGGTGSTEGSTGQYMMVLGQYGSVLCDTLWYWVSIERYWLIYNGTDYWVSMDQYLLVLGGTGSVYGGNG